ncbi:MAG: excinuclease ABC subunit UvrC [Phycisphaeraceae bacterium]|nr:excinuclease ABC subunit UvrC [Phycisphaeraceae bacterium]
MERGERLKSLLDKARKLPKVPGVYLMKDDRGRVVYVGKAGCLPDRVSSYFVPSAELGGKKQSLLDFVHDFDHIECEGEWEALLMENRLIKDIHPRFNAQLVDDKTYPYLIITIKDDFPGVFISRQPNAPEFKGAKVLGPFTSVYALKESIALLQRVFKFRTCHLEIRADDDKRRFFRPCLLYPIKQCTAPCGARISQSEYARDIARFVRFLESKRSVMQREMQDEMESAAKALDFERAAVLRDQLKALEKLDHRGSQKDRWQPEAEAFRIEPRKGLESLRKALGMTEPIRLIECIDIAHLQGGETVGSKVTFIDGRPFKNEYRRYRIQSVPGGNDDYMAIREVVSRRYREAGEGGELYPDLIIIDGGLGQLHAALEAFDQLNVKPPMVISLAKKEEIIYTQARSEPIRLSRTHLGLRICQAIRDESHRFAQHYHHILRRKKTLGQEPRPAGKKKRVHPPTMLEPPHGQDDRG